MTHKLGQEVSAERREWLHCCGGERNCRSIKVDFLFLYFLFFNENWCLSWILKEEEPLLWEQCALPCEPLPLQPAVAIISGIVVDSLIKILQELPHWFLKKFTMISFSSGCHYVLLPPGPKVHGNTEDDFTWGLKMNIGAKYDALEICSKPLLTYQIHKK